MGFGLYLLDNSSSSLSIYKLHDKKKLNLNKIDKFFKVCSFLNIYYTYI